MATAAAPYGFRPVYHPSGLIRSNRYDGILQPLTNVNIYKNQPVKLVFGTGAAVNGVTIAAGQVALAPWTAVGDALCGVFAGIEYTDVNQRRQVSDFFPANLAVAAGSVITAWIWDDPWMYFQAQCDGALNSGLNCPGRQLNGSNFGNGSTGTGLSSCTLGASTIVATTVQGQFRIQGFSWDIADSPPGDAFPDVIVQIAKHQLSAQGASI